tara:strand:+ start:55 stop:1608 length:1554 start_codon:yes stop_codon:yes gene_type:complete
MATSTLGNGTLVLAGTTSGTTTVTATAVAGTTTLTLPAATDTLVGKATTDTLTNKTLTGAVMNGTLGATTPSTASVTTLTTSSTVTHNGGTANGVPYLNGSKVLTTGSALVFDGSNLGVGVTPSASTNLTNIEMPQGVQIGARKLSGYPQMYLSSNVSGDAYSPTYKINGYAVQYRLEASAGKHEWYTAPSGTAGNAISFTQAMTLDASGQLGIGTTSPSGKLHVLGSGGTRSITADTTGYAASLSRSTGGDFYVGINDSAGATFGSTAYARILWADGAYPMVFATNSTERARIDSSGNFQLGAVNDGVTKSFTVYQGGGAEGTVYGTFIRTSGGSSSLEIQNANDFFANAANAACRMGRNSVNSRSLNAGGTVNASGADYAEYMTKAGDFTIAKGDVIGIDANGKLTNVFANAVSFMVKSTDPSYVGGDAWGAGLEDDAEALEAARQRVDRIAFAGQVPVNVMGATAGQYIIPVNDNGAIKGEAVSNPTFEQYQIAVGKVIAIESDGRAKIIVKVA